MELKAVGISSIIDQDHLRHLPVDNPEILHIGPVWDQKAILPEQTVVDKHFGWVKVIQDHIGITGVTGSENDDFTLAIEMVEQFLDSRANVDTSVDNFASRNCNGQFNVMFHFQVLRAMDQSLIQVKDNRFLP